MSLRKKLIRLAYSDEALRPHILPLLKEAADKPPAHAWPATLEQVKKNIHSRFPREWAILISNTQGGSSKFWQAWGHGPEDPVNINWGKIGQPRRTIQKDWAYAEKAVRQKLRKGYVYGVPKKVHELTPASKKELLTKGGHALAYLSGWQSGLAGRIQEIDQQLETIQEERQLDLGPLRKDLANAAKTTNKGVSEVVALLKKALPAAQKMKTKQAFFWGKSKPEARKDWRPGIIQQIEDLRPYASPVFNGSFIPAHDWDRNALIDWSSTKLWSGQKPGPQIMPWLRLYAALDLYFTYFYGASGATIDAFWRVGQEIKNF